MKWRIVDTVLIVLMLLSIAHSLGKRAGYKDGWRECMDMQTMVRDRVDQAIAAGVIP